MIHGCEECTQTDALCKGWSHQRITPLDGAVTLIASAKVWFPCQRKALALC